MPLPHATRLPARACNGIVTSPHALATQTGVRVLQDGGNAADAGIAVAAALSVLYPHMTGVGGDVFFLYYDAGGSELCAYNGSGAAAGLATRDFFLQSGFRQIPERGPAAALTTPGTVDAWFALHERFGTKPMAQLLRPAIGYATEGAPVARSLANAIAVHRSMLDADPGILAIFPADGSGYGQILRQPALAASLEAISREGRDWFYQGAGATAIARCSRETGGPLREEDLANHKGTFVTAARSSFLGYHSVTTPPNSQGIALLVAQRVLEQYCAGRFPDDGSAPLVHACVEAIRLAFADRDAHVGDPYSASTWPDVLTPEHTKNLAQRIEAYNVAGEQDADPTARRADTAYFACVDRHGNAVSFIQSLFHGFGAGIAVPELGIILNNRGCAFSLEPHPRRTLEPGRRPFHTLMPCMLMRNEKPWLVYGSMGGEGQPQTALQLSLRIAHFGLDPQTAIEAPRWRYGATWLHEGPSIHVESRVSDACIAGLRARGHTVQVLGPWEESMGHAGAIVIGDDGVLSAGYDPRGDGSAAGF